ncbi:MAG: hypothetical protein J7L82_00700 [Staphylothermus sp.]|nr:hypothetical protein [Staphylothermus sp.]
MSYKAIMNIVPVVQSASLLGENIKASKKKKEAGDMMKMGTKNIVGVNLIKINADLIGGL